MPLCMRMRDYIVASNKINTKSVKISVYYYKDDNLKLTSNKTILLLLFSESQRIYLKNNVKVSVASLG